MQGQQSGVGFFPQVGFEHGSTSNDACLDQQMFWNSIGTSGQSLAPNFMASSGDTDMRYVNGVNHHGQTFSGWNFRESSSMLGQNEVTLNDQKTIHGWSAPIIASDGSVLQSEIQQHGPSNVLSAGNFNVNLLRNGAEDANETLLVQNSGSRQLPQDLNMNTVLVEDDDCQILEGPPIYNKPGSSRTQPIHFSSSPGFASSSSDPFGMSNGSSSDGRRLSRKRKILEGIVEQPRGSGSGSTSYIQHSDSSLWHAIPARASASDGPNAATPMGGSSHSLNLLEQVNPSFGSSTRQVAGESSTLLANSGSMESSRRNSRLRINGTHQQGSIPSSIFSIESATGNINLSSSHHLLSPLPQNSLATRPPTSSAANTNPEAQPVVGQLSSLHRNPQPGWNPPSSLRTRNLSNFPVSGDRSGASFDPSYSGGVPRNISDHPMFAQLSESRNSVQSAPSWGIAGGNVNNPGNVASSSQNGGGANAHPAATSRIPHQSPSQFPSRLSGSVRRALLSAADAGSRAQNSSHPSLHSGPSSSQGVSLSSGSRRQSRHSQSRQAMLLERHMDGAPGIPFSVRALATSNDGRARLMSELRNALELVRRGEGLRPQDAMILDPSVFFGMMDMHDRHRDMRLDVDNMSYEELLALEDRIGSVNTGLSEESIVKQLKQKKHARRNVDETETEPCCICQEEYNEGEDVGTLDCGHDFHGVCIKQWLMHKNLCPICKTTGLTK